MARIANKSKNHRQKLRLKKIEDVAPEKRVYHLLEFGILAPSTHNTQPWKLKVPRPDIVEIYADLSKKIPEADPSTRDLYISVGALMSNIRLAAQEFGINADIQKHKPGATGHVATIKFGRLDKARTPKSSKMLDAIVYRQNYRGFFKQTSLNEKDVQGVLAATHTTQSQLIAYFDKPLITQVAELTAEGLRLAYAKPEFRREISSFINHNLSRKKHGLHGYSLRLNLRRSIIVPKVMKRKDIGSKLAQLNYASFVSSPGMLVLFGRDKAEDWLRGGEMLQETLLRLYQIGISSSIYAAAIEMGNLRDDLKKLLKADKETIPQLIICIGQQTLPLPFSVRKPLRSFMVE